MNAKLENLNSLLPDAGDLEAFARSGLAQRACPASPAELQRMVRSLARLRPAALHALRVAASQPQRSGDTPAQAFHLALRTLES